MGVHEEADSLVESIRRERIGAALFGHASPKPTIGRFEILGSLGRGGMGEVLDARDPTLDRPVALKLLQQRAATQQPRLLREAQALARLSHPNVVQIYEVGLVDGRPFLAMERLRGQTLHAWQTTPRPWPEVLAAYLQAGAGLAAAHQEGLIHRDFKPSNCMIDDHGRVRVLDFGLARAAHEQDTETDALVGVATESSDANDASSTRQSLLGELLTRSGALLGTIVYMAPEQLLGVTAEAHSDQFGFCVALFEALHGHRPFVGRSGAELLLAIQRRAIEPGRPRDGLPAVPAALDRIVQRGLALDPADRWPSMRALLDALADVQHGRRRHWAYYLAGGSLVLGIATLVAFTLLRGPQPQPCAGLRELEAPAWTIEQRDAIEQVVLEVGGTRGPELWRAVERSLDRYANEWIAARAEACEATHEQHSAGPETLELRLACLDRRMQRMQALVEQLSLVDRSRLAQAVAAAQSLPSLDACTDAEALLRGAVDLGPGERARQLRLERLIDEGWALHQSGQAAAAASRADAAIEQVAALADDRPIVAEAHFLRGALRFEMRQILGARADLHAAFRSAERAQQPALIGEILTALVRLEVWSRRASAAEAWLIVAQTLERDMSPSDQAALALAEGLLHLELGELQVAIEKLERAVALRRAGSSELQLATALRLLGEAQASAGEHADAHASYREAIELARANAGLLELAQTLHDLGRLERELDQLGPAREAYGQALALQIEMFGDRAPISVHTRIGLAELALLEGDLAAAEREAAAAQLIAEIDGALEAEDRGLLGMMLASVRRELGQPAAALDDYAWARESFLAMSEVDHGAVAMAESGAADCLVALGRSAEARLRYEQALERLAAHVEPSHERWLYPQMGLGHLLVEAGEREAARPLLERALELLLAGPEDPQTEAQIRNDLARADRRPLEGASDG